MTKRYGNRMEVPQLKLKEGIKATMESWKDSLRKNPSMKDAEIELSGDGTILQITTKDIHVRVTIDRGASEDAPFSLSAFNSKSDLYAARNPKIVAPMNKKDIEGRLGI